MKLVMQLWRLRNSKVCSKHAEESVKLGHSNVQRHGNEESYVPARGKMSHFK